jgi:hypothetical protein
MEMGSGLIMTVHIIAYFFGTRETRIETDTIRGEKKYLLCASWGALSD